MPASSAITLSLRKTISLVFASEGDVALSPNGASSATGEHRPLPGFSLQDCSYVWEEAHRNNQTMHLSDCFVKITQQMISHLRSDTLSEKEKSTLVNFLCDSGAIQLQVTTSKLPSPDKGNLERHGERVCDQNDRTYSMVEFGDPDDGDANLTTVQSERHCMGQGEYKETVGVGKKYKKEKLTKKSYEKFDTSAPFASVEVTEDYGEGQELQESRVGNSDLCESIRIANTASVHDVESENSPRYQDVNFVESISIPRSSDDSDAKPAESAYKVVPGHSVGEVYIKRENPDNEIIYMCSSEEPSMSQDGEAAGVSMNQSLSEMESHDFQSSSHQGLLGKHPKSRKLKLKMQYSSSYKKRSLGEKGVLCSICSDEFDNRNKLKMHMKVHCRGGNSDVRPFKCKDCSEKFESEESLLVHQRFHIYTGETPYQCDLCGKAFKSKNRLIPHMRTHTGEKPYQCLLCGKRFNDKSNLNAHQRVHTGEKPFICSVCGTSFGHRSNLRKHFNRYHAGETLVIQ